MSAIQRLGVGRYATTTTEGTIQLGRALGEVLRAGDIVVLNGDLGAGKTQLTKGIAAALGATTDVVSPTFTIQMVHEGTDVDLCHFDLYRLEDPEQLGDAGLLDAAGGDCVCVIEWGERFADDIGPERLDVLLTKGEPPVDALGCDDLIEVPRTIELVPHGTRAEEVVRSLDTHIMDSPSLSD